ncbi:hypothetical protein Tco_1522401 [Tanacetum coccineum]
MHTRASNSELVEPLTKPEHTLSQRFHRRNRRVPFEQRNNPPQQPRVVYAPILDINYFCHFLITLKNLNPMDDEPMWAVDRVVALTPGSAITIPETTNEFTIKGSSNSNTNKIMARMDVMTMKMNAQYKEFQSCSKPNPDHNDDDIPMLREEEAKFMQTFYSDKLRHDQKCKKMKLSQDMQLIQKLRHDQKRMKKVFEVMSGRNIVTNSRVTPSWREIVSLTFSEAGVLHDSTSKWRAKVMEIEESKDLSSLALDELIGNLKVHEVVMEKDSKIYRGKKERVKSIALKARKSLVMTKLRHPEAMTKNMLWP